MRVDSGLSGRKKAPHIHLYQKIKEYAPSHHPRMKADISCEMSAFCRFCSLLRTTGNENCLLNKGISGNISALSFPPVFTGVVKLYLRDGQRASCDKLHAQVARDLGRK